MKLFSTLWCIFIAMFALGLVSVTSAYAETAYWLEEGNAITVLTSTMALGLLSLTNLALGSEVTVHCEGELVGSVGAEGEGEITAIINSTKKEVSKSLTGEFADCEVTSIGLCTNASLAEVWPVELPWHLHLLLMEPGPEFLDILLAETGKIPGYEVKCSGPLGAFSNKCEGQTSSLVENTAGVTVNDIFSKVVGTESSPCELGEGSVEGEGLVELLNGSTLSVSPEPAPPKTAFWLEDGVSVTSLMSTIGTGLLSLTNLALGSEVTVHCEGVLMGSVGAEGEGEISEVLTESVATGTPLTGKFVNCLVTTTNGLCTHNSLAEVWPTELPWHTHVVSMETPEPKFLAILLSEAGKIPGYEVKCSGTLGAFSNKCMGQTSASVENAIGITVNDVLNKSVGTESSPCELGEGSVEGEGLVELLDGLTLSVSPEAPPAEVAFWLEDAVAITSLQSTGITGLLFLTDAALGDEVTVHCEGEFMGSVGAKGEGEITEVLTSGVATGTPLVGKFVDCEATTSGLCTLHSLAELWPVELPWHTSLVLSESPEPEYLDILLPEAGKIPGYEVKCSGPLGAFVNECQGQTSFSVENTAGITTTGLLSETAGTERIPCELGTGITEGEGLLELLSGLTLAVSMSIP